MYGKFVTNYFCPQHKLHLGIYVYLHLIKILFYVHIHFNKLPSSSININLTKYLWFNIKIL